MMKRNEVGQDLFPEIDPIGTVSNDLETIEVFPHHQEIKIDVDSPSENDQKRKKLYKHRGPLHLYWWKETGKTYEQQINEACLLIKYISLYNVGDIIQMATYMKEVYSVEKLLQIVTEECNPNTQPLST